MAITLQSFLARGYFPKEVPPALRTAEFAAYATTTGFSVSPPSAKKPLLSKPAIHNLARPSGLRRPLHIPNPFSYYELCDLLVTNWKRIDQFIKRSQFSVSVPIEDPNNHRALKPKYDGTDLGPQRAYSRASGKFLLRTDIARFYSSVYTHSIPWALDGKDTAKKKRTGGLGNELDRLTRNMQDGQTLGIPIGPDSSLVIAEIIASTIDRLVARYRVRGLRFMDDYELVFSSRSAAEEALPLLERFLAEYELEINQLKTGIEELPIELERRWNAEVRSYSFSDPQEVSDLELIAYFDRLFTLKHAYPRDAVLSYGIRRLRGMSFNDWDLFQGLAFQSAAAEPGAVDPIMTHLFDKGITPDPKATDRFISVLLERHAPLGHGSEVAWVLWFATWFKRPIKNSLARSLDGNPDPIVALLAYHAKQQGIINKSVSFSKWNDIAASGKVYGPHWLLVYEAHRQGWLPKSKVAGDVATDLNFGPMLAANVSFIDTQVVAPTTTALLSPLPDEDDFLAGLDLTYGF